MENTTEISECDLAQFIGTEHYYEHSMLPGFVYTDGVKFLAERAGAHWLVDLVASWQTEPKVRDEPFQLWTLELDGEGGAVAYVQSDSDEPRLAEQVIEYTDFPEQLGPKFECYVCAGAVGDKPALVMMLKSEY
jgi:hypothetical protein